MIKTVLKMIDDENFIDIEYMEKSDYIILDEKFIIVNGNYIKGIYDIMDNAPYYINGKLYAVWDMRKNYHNWNSIDIFCGIVHEMVHCCQIKNHINIIDEEILHKVAHNIDIANKNFNNIDILSICIEGAALYIELFYKSKITGKNITLLLEDYKEFSFIENKYWTYYVGAKTIHKRIQEGIFSWKRYFIEGDIIQ